MGARLATPPLVLGGLGVLVLATALATEALFARDVTLMTGRKGAAEIEEWRELRDPADDPAEIYGQPQPGPPRRVLLLPGSDAELVSLPEVPRRRMLFVDENPGLHLPDARALREPTWGLGALLLTVAFVLHGTKLPVVRPGAAGRS